MAERGSGAFPAAGGRRQSGAQEHSRQETGDGRAGLRSTPGSRKETADGGTREHV